MRTHLNSDTSQWPEIWRAAYQILEQTIVPNQLQAWIQPLELVSTEMKDNVFRIRLATTNDFSADWVRDRFLKHLQDAFSQVSGSECEVIIQAREKATEEVSAPEFELASEPLEPVSSPVGSGVVISAGSRPVGENNLDPQYTFDTFVVGSSNQFAHASAVAVAEHPARQYNPLYIYSSPGLGKTHLLHAIGNHLLARRPNARVAYLSAEKFVNELIESVQHRRMSQFRAKYRDSFDLILIDDIQFIAGKTTSEEEFFHTFNALYQSKRQIVVTCDRRPKDIDGLEERIRTRFECGLVVDITPPEIETRIAILKSKAEREDIYLPDDVATFLASYIKSNVRELEGVLVKLQLQASLTGAEISLEMAKQELRVATHEEGAHYTVDAIQNAVAKHYHLKIADLKASSRARQVALPRQIAMHLVRKYAGLGFKEIGRYFGDKDHTTVMHACKKIDSMAETNPEIRDAVEAIQNLL